MEIIVVLVTVLALSGLAWLIWQLIKAKRFNRFKQKIEDELKDKVIVSIINELEENRSNLYPNNDSHQEATVFYWTQYKSRILHTALQREIITEQWLRSSGNLRNAQHLFYVEKKFIL